MYICSQVTSSRDGFPVVVYCLLTKAFRKEDCDQLTALNFKNISFCLIYSALFLYLHGNVTSVIRVISLLHVVNWLIALYCLWSY